MDLIVVLFALVVGLLAGGVGAIWLVAPLVGREEAHWALAWYVARRQIEDIRAQARERMWAVVARARQRPSGSPSGGAFRPQRPATDATAPQQRLVVKPTTWGAPAPRPDTPEPVLTADDLQRTAGEEPR
jgi:hypothetical protein